MVRVDTGIHGRRLGRKQTIDDPNHWLEAMAESRDRVPDAELDALIDRSVERVKAELRNGKRVGYGWSGGKDSIALRYVMELAGVEDAVLGCTSALEWPAFEEWVEANKPEGLAIHAAPLDLHWLRDRPHMLFPTGANGPRWFTLVQHKAQRQFFTERKLDLLALGRRRSDGNYVGPKGQDRYTNAQGVTRWSPLADWPHEAVFALIEREALPLPPIYFWPRGFQVGTGPWPARQWTGGVDNGFAECWQIDPDVVRHAATVLPQAREWLARTQGESV